MKMVVGSLGFLVLVVFPLQAAEPVGIFDDHLDIGEPGIPGYVEYEEASGTYRVDAVGATIGNRRFTDEAHFAFKRISGSFAIEANPYPVEDIGRGGLMIRQSIDPDSIHISLLMTSAAASDGNSDLGSVFPTFRTAKGGGSVRDGDPYDVPGGFTANHTGPIRLERIGNSVHMYTMNDQGAWVWFQSEAAPFEEEVLAGLAATAENTNNLGLFEFTGVRIEELPLYVGRDLPTDELTKGARLTGIKLTAKARTPVETATVREVVPLGAVASNFQASAGTVTPNPDGSISWIIPNLTGEATLTYDVVLGQRMTAAWRGTFNDGVHRESFIGGESILPKTIQFTPAAEPIEIDPIFPTIIEAERGNWIRAETDFGIMADLNAAGGVVVVAMSGSAQGILEYPIHIQQAGTYYVFGRVKSYDGNSDSFHFEIDDYPAGNETSYWTVSSRKTFANEWVSDEATPRSDPRAFELDAGVHYLYLANREDSCVIDWLCVTNNRGLTITTFSESTQYFIARSIPNPRLEPGKTYSVTITRAAVSEFQPEMVVTETPPPGWTVSGQQVSGGTLTTNAQGQLVWSLTGVGGSQTLTYTVAPPSGDVKGGLFAGHYTYLGQSLPLPGDTTIAQAFTFANVNVPNPTPVKLVNGEAKIEAEDAYLVKPSAEAPDPFTIRYRPDASGELYAYAARGASAITNEELVFVFEVTEPGVYRAIGRTCTPSGSDDSFFLGMDDDIGVDLNAYRYQGTLYTDEAGNRVYDENFHIGWVTVDGDMNKSWNLTAGVHRLRIHVREDGTMLDWILITNNLDQNPADLEEPPAAVEQFMLY
ncbi:MAG: hypothetical protein HPY51_05105 [Candidatus Omnitrophica bacterium]|nr:hypothetical protein [Candidatus Omnitrophota bacterium]